MVFPSGNSSEVLHESMKLPWKMVFTPGGGTLGSPPSSPRHCLLIRDAERYQITPGTLDILPLPPPTYDTPVFNQLASNDLLEHVVSISCFVQWLFVPTRDPVRMRAMSGGKHCGCVLPGWVWTEVPGLLDFWEPHPLGQKKTTYFIRWFILKHFRSTDHLAAS